MWPNWRPPIQHRSALIAINQRRLFVWEKKGGWVIHRVGQLTSPFGPQLSAALSTGKAHMCRHRPPFKDLSICEWVGHKTQTSAHPEQDSTTPNRNPSSTQPHDMPSGSNLSYWERLAVIGKAIQQNLKQFSLCHVCLVPKRGENRWGKPKSFKRLEQSATNCIVSRSICGHANGDISPTYSYVYLLGYINIYI